MNKTDILNAIEYVYKNNLAKEVNILNLKIHNIYVSMYMIYKNIELNEYNIHYYKTLADNIKNEYNKQLAYNKDILQNELNKKIYV